MSSQPPPAAASSTARGHPARRLPFHFSGSGREYFRIWIVNLLLTLLTLGVYSAWAKVRRNRYFYGHTRLADASFEYLADPITILKGRLIAFGLFIAYGALGHLWAPAQLVLGLAFLGLVPWLVVKSLAFRARNTAYRNISFGFKGRYGEALKVYVLLPMLIFLTFGLILPFIVQRQKQFIVTRSAFGATPFAFSAKVGDFYKLYLLALGLLLGAAVVFALLTPTLPWLGAVLLAPLYLFLFAYVNAGTANLVFNGARLEMHAFRSTLRARDLFMLYLTNVLGIIATLGLFIPWAQVRLARYRAARLEMLAVGDLSYFVAGEKQKVSSTGEEVGEMFDVDIGL